MACFTRYGELGRSISARWHGVSRRASMCRYRCELESPDSLAIAYVLIGHDLGPDRTNGARDEGTDDFDLGYSIRWSCHDACPSSALRGFVRGNGEASELGPLLRNRCDPDQN